MPFDKSIYTATNYAYARQPIACAWAKQLESLPGLKECPDIWLGSVEYWLSQKQVSAIADEPTWRAASWQRVLQTKADACDWTKMTTFVMVNVLSYSQSQLLLKVTNFNLPHLHLAPLLGVTPCEFCWIFNIRKLESLGYCAALFAWSYI